jgi:cytochrome c oxidase subunit 2
MLTAILGEVGDKTLWMPEQASTYAAASDDVFYGVYYLSVFFFVLITLLLVVFIVKYRHREDGKVHEPAAGHSTALELTWTIIPTILVLVIFYYGFRGFINMAVEPPNAYEVGVRGKTWSWTFTYDQQYVSDDGALHLLVNRPVRFVLSSDDVIHSFFIPAFRSKKDVVPGRYNSYWVTPTKTGKFSFTCAEYCGEGHSSMYGDVIVQEKPEFDEWIKRIKNPYIVHSPFDVGKMYYETRGCAGCHTIDGKASTGPTFKDLFGSQVPIKGMGNVLADENYIKESILDAQAKIVEGFPSPSPMPPFAGQFSDRDVDSIIIYLKSLSVHFKGDLSPYKVIAPTSRPASGPATKPTARVDKPIGEVTQVWSSNHVR